jgi:hypothetical protein
MLNGILLGEPDVIVLQPGNKCFTFTDRHVRVAW